MPVLRPSRFSDPGHTKPPLKHTKPGAHLGQLLRTIGFASAPGLLRVFAAVPVAGSILEAVLWVWMLAATVVAVRQALDYTSTLRAVAVCLLGWFIYVGFLLWTTVLFGAPLFGS